MKSRSQRPELTYRYYISSADLTAERAGDAIREHGGIGTWMSVYKKMRVKFIETMPPKI